MDSARWADPGTPPSSDRLSGGDLPLHAALRTADVDESRAFCRGLFYGPLRVMPVGDTSGFDFSADVVQLGPVTVGEVSYGMDVRMTIEDLVTAYHVLVPLAGWVQSRHRGIEVLADPARAAVYRPAGDIDLRWGADSRLLSVKVDRAALERELDATMDRQMVSPLPLDASFDVRAGPGRTWTALVRLLHSELGGHGGLATQPRMAGHWLDLVLSGLAVTVEESFVDEPPPVPRRPRTVKRALDAMHAEPWRQFSAKDLAATAGVGVRVLQEAFRRHVGVPPLTYLRRLRLDGVHAELSRADPALTSVGEVAFRWGFTHLGRFAGAYRERFGVPPSQTLNDRG